MPLLILAIIITIPYLEFLVFMKVGNEIGGFSALMLTILTAFLGIYIIRQEGIQVLGKLKETIERGESPVSEIIHGFFLAIAGFFFLLPGFITDSIAVLLAIGPIRTMLGNMMMNSKIYHNRRDSHSSFSSGITIDGDFKETDDQDDDNYPKNIENDKNDRENN